MKGKCKIFKHINKRLCARFPKYKLSRICRTIGIKPYSWQRDYALGRTAKFGGGAGRATGKTMAVMLHLLMAYTNSIDLQMFGLDPDWDGRNPHRRRWYINEYRKLYTKCINAGIPVPALLKTDIDGWRR